jgi:hypothetical protein
LVHIEDFRKTTYHDLLTCTLLVMRTLGSPPINPHIACNLPSKEKRIKKEKERGKKERSFKPYFGRTTTSCINCSKVHKLPARGARSTHPNSPKSTLNPSCAAEPYIGCPYPCSWVLGGHECDVIVHGWACVASVLCIPASNSKS